MLTIKKLSECKLDEALIAWNSGFEGYYFDASMDVDRFFARFGLENLSPSLSIIAFDGEKPVGILLSGLKKINGKNIAWNGGTGVATAYRRIGVGKLLIDKAVDLYKEADVEISTLEALSENTRAIKLYEQKGYKKVDEVIHLRNDVVPEFYGSQDYQAIYTSAHDAQFFSMYQTDTPWQSQWFSMKEGQALQLIDSEGKTVAYGLFKRQFDADGTLKSVIVTHCYVREDVSVNNNLIDSLFSHLFPPSITNYECTVAFFLISNKRIYHYLLEKGFTRKVNQVWMKRLVKEGVKMYGS
ncbi:GNAT family N-acetyltransferase [Sutcliffiella halmapala]|uniref:GNAT family N-acetyltransferase n=1 Tax=Sutcliffiella halmapala TaxID=79882 RepID=UPI001473955E|nr:GNAT family N-acetyltransferase [Sutcliffiella halmapala]